MTKPTLPIEGSCRCGRVRLRISAQPILTMACHCSGCQKMSASAYSLSAAVPAEGFEVIEGEPEIGGLHGPDAHHYHCPHCKSWMFTRPEGMDWFVNLRPTMLDDTKWFSPFIETYTSEKLPWATTPAVHSYETFPPFEAYEGLVKEFAEKS
jgi:hypothetical protein